MKRHVGGALGGLRLRGIGVCVHIVAAAILGAGMGACSDRVSLTTGSDDNRTFPDAGRRPGQGQEPDASEGSGAGADSGGEQTPGAVAADGSVPHSSPATDGTGAFGQGSTGAGSNGMSPDAGPGQSNAPGFLPEELPLATLPVVEPDPLDFNLGPDTPLIAAQLARFIWRTAPDATTVDLARRGKLTSAADVYAEAQRLLGDPRSEQGFQSFFGAWTEVSRAEDVAAFTAADSGTPESADYAAAARAELYEFALGVVTSGGRFSDLLLDPFELGEASLVEVFNDEPLTSRSGLLVQPFVLAAGSYADRTSPSRRGAFIARRLLCQDVSPNEHTLHADVPPEETVREWIVGETTDAECKTCHAVIDPLGFAFEAFDQWGKARAEDKGHAVHTETALIALGLGQVKEPRDVGLELLAHPDVMPCFLSHWFEYALQRQLRAADVQSWVELERGSEFYSLREIPALIASSDAFRAQSAE